MTSAGIGFDGCHNAPGGGGTAIACTGDCFFLPLMTSAGNGFDGCNNAPGGGGTAIACAGDCFLLPLGFLPFLTFSSSSCIRAYWRRTSVPFEFRGPAPHSRPIGS